MELTENPALLELDTRESLWERFYSVAPLVVIGTRDMDGQSDLAPKHLAFPLGWENYFGFICTPRHATYRNVLRDQGFAVSFPRPSQITLVGLTASPRSENHQKEVLASLPTFPASKTPGVFLQGAYLYLECSLHRVVDGFGTNSLIAGKVESARIDPAALRMSDREDAEVVAEAPLLAYLYPNRFATIEKSLSFPFPEGFRR